MAYIKAVQNGNFSSPSTWGGGVVPTTGDIAACGPYRITLDLLSIDCAISDTNVDWVAAGGGTLSTTRTGGFDVPNGATITIAEYRYTFTTGVNAKDITI